MAPSHTSMCWEEAGRETSFLFKWPSHACVCRGQVFPALRSQSAVPSTVPWAEPWWHCHHPCSCHAPPALSSHPVSTAEECPAQFSLLSGP